MASVAHRVGPADQGMRLTLEEYESADFEPGYRYELARGVLEVSEVPDDWHGVIVCWLYKRLTLFDQTHPGLIFRFGGGGEFRLRIPEMISGRHPDVSVAFQGTPEDARGRRPPSLVIEILSEGSEARRRDYEVKREEYLAFGIAEYWIVDQFERKITVLTRENNRWREILFGDGEEAESFVLPGFRVAVAEIMPA